MRAAAPETDTYLATSANFTDIQRATGGATRDSTYMTCASGAIGPTALPRSMARRMLVAARCAVYPRLAYAAEVFARRASSSPPR